MKRINGEMLSLEECLERHEGLVNFFCNRLVPRAAVLGITYDDLYQEGMIALMQSYHKFNRADLRFSTYARPTIHGTLLNYLNRLNLGVHYPHHVREIAYAVRKQGWEETVSVAQVVETFIVTEQKARNVIDFLRHRAPVYLDQPASSKESAESLDTYFLMPVHDDLSEVWVNEFISTLDARNQVITRMRMEGHTNRHIGDTFGITSSAVRERQKTIQKKLRSYLAERKGRIYEQKIQH